MHRICHKILEARLAQLQSELHVIQTNPTRQKQRKKRIWTQKWILRREQCGFTNTIMRELAAEESQDFKNIIQMTESQLNEQQIQIIEFK